MLGAGKSASVEKLLIERDRIHLSLESGTIHFLEPVNGVVYGAEFHGRGRARVEPPNAIEAQQLRLRAGKDVLDLEFSDAVLLFTDGTYEEAAKGLHFSPSGAPGPAPLAQRRMQEREAVGAEFQPRLFKGITSSDRQRTSVFFADLNTPDKGWVTVRFDALDPEEVLAGRWVKWTRLTQFESWTHFPAREIAVEDAFRDPLAREDFYIRSYNIESTITEAQELASTARVAIESKTSGERVYLFELDSNLRVESVTDSQGRELAYFQPADPKNRDQSHGDYVAVVLAEPNRADQAEKLTFRYRGKHLVERVGSGNYYCQSYGWYPSRPTSFAARADFDLKFRVPRKFTLVATGSKVGESVEEPYSVTTWKSDIPLAVAGFAFGDFKVLSEKAGDVDVEIYANRNPDDVLASVQATYHVYNMGTLSPAAVAKTMSIEMKNTLQLFEQYFGPYPYRRLVVTNIAASYGQGWPGLIYLSALSFLDKTQRERLGLGKYNIELGDFFRAHESSHQWWGHRVGWKSYHDQWLSEGFAQFSGNLYVFYRQGGPKEYLNCLRRDRRDMLLTDKRNRPLESLGPVWMGVRLATEDAPQAYQSVVYGKGGYLLHSLRMMLFDPSGKSENPDRRFIAMMQDFTRTYDNKPASTADFQAIAEKHMLPFMDLDGNRKLDWLFRQYIYGTGIPKYELAYSAQNTPDGKVKVTGTIRQSGVPDGWRDVLPVYMHQASEPRLLGWIRTTGKETRVDFTLPFNPGRLSLNDYEDILADIKQ